MPTTSSHPAGLPRWLRRSTLSTLWGGRLEYESLNDPRLLATRAQLAATELPVFLRGKPYAVGANLGVRREVFDAIGGFDESFGVGSDEIDFCLRAQYQGHTIGFAPGAVVHYRVRTSLPSLVKQFYSYALGRAHLYRKHMDLGELEARSLRQKRDMILGFIRHLIRVRGLLEQEGRWLYV